MVDEEYFQEVRDSVGVTGNLVRREGLEKLGEVVVQRFLSPIWPEMFSRRHKQLRHLNS